MRGNHYIGDNETFNNLVVGVSNSNVNGLYQYKLAIPALPFEIAKGYDESNAVYNADVDVLKNGASWVCRLNSVDWEISILSTANFSITPSYLSISYDFKYRWK